jgi:hypothetical protein
MVRDSAAAKDWVDQSRIHWDQGDVGRALHCCDEALRLDPLNVDALANAGTLKWVAGNSEEAERLYLRAHKLAPTHVGVMVNLAALRNDAADVEGALDWIDRAGRQSPDNPEVVWRRSLLELAMGDYANGWEHYEAGLRSQAMRGTGPGFRTAPWNGNRCDRLLIWHEQGFGDTIQFVRYAKLCKERAEKVSVLCPKELIALLKSCPFVDAASDAVDDGDFDQQISIMSLPHLFGTTLDTVPAPIPYLFADDALAAKWASRIDGTRFNVGLVWAANFRRGQPRFGGIDQRRSVSLSTLRPILEVPKIDFYSLQKGEFAKEATGTNVRDFMDEVTDFAETAALIKYLDLVISVDTSVAHLAGALGKPVWVLSRHDACWRWLRNRPDSPWYPAARIFGQAAPGDWTSVIANVARELERVTP